MRNPLAASRALLFPLALTIALAFISGACRSRVRVDSLSSARRPSRAEISRDGDPFAVILSRRDASSWSLLVDETRAFPTDGQRVKGFLEELSSRQSIVRVASGGGSDYGIGNAGSYRIAVVDERANGKGERLSFGDTDATGEWVYFSREGDPAVFRASSLIVPFLDVRASSWAELAPYREKLASCDVQEVSFRDITYRAGTDAKVAAFGESLGKLTAMDVTNYEFKPEIAVRVSFGDATATVLGFAPAGSDWFLLDGASGLSYVVSGTSCRELFASLCEQVSY